MDEMSSLDNLWIINESVSLFIDDRRKHIIVYKFSKKAYHCSWIILSFPSVLRCNHQIKDSNPKMYEYTIPLRLMNFNAFSNSMFHALFTTLSNAPSTKLVKTVEQNVKWNVSLIIHQPSKSDHLNKGRSSVALHNLHCQLSEHWKRKKAREWTTTKRQSADT